MTTDDPSVTPVHDDGGFSEVVAQIDKDADVIYDGLLAMPPEVLAQVSVCQMQMAQAIREKKQAAEFWAWAQRGIGIITKFL